MDINILTDDTQRAVWMLDNAGRDTDDVLREIGESVEHYISTHGNEDKLPYPVCGAVCAVVAAANLYGVATESEQGLEGLLSSFGRLNEAGWHAAHAIEHNDPMAVAVFTPETETETVEHVVARMSEWVLSHLPEADPDVFLESLDLESQVSES